MQISVMKQECHCTTMTKMPLEENEASVRQGPI